MDSEGVTDIYYFYDDSGNIFGFSYNGTNYYYQFNLQGDVIGIYNANGQLVVEYKYDAWGKVLSVTGLLASTVGQTNAIRYRRYYYDSETGFYLTGTRYYDPEIGRFINADNLVASGGVSVQGYNLFVYCFNNPINMSDPSGNWPKFIETAANWVNKNIIQPIINYVNNNYIKYDVPLYDQGNTNSCWAYSQAMIEDYKTGTVRTQQGADKRAKEIAVQRNGETNWDTGGKPINKTEVNFNSIQELHTALKTHGPLYASYGYYHNGDRQAGHAVVVTGVNLFTNRVYTNNPWGIKGSQKYSAFITIFTGETGDGWKLDSCYYLY